MKPSLHLGRNRVNTYAIRNSKLLSGIKDSHHGPSDAMHNPSSATQGGNQLQHPFTKTICARLNSILQPRNPVKEILLKLNLPNHRSILTDSKICIKMDTEILYRVDGGEFMSIVVNYGLL
ncbi:hypothetical protein Tco_0825027 [Tanacetum coccineum]